MIEMRGKSTMLTSTLYILLNILAPCWWILTGLLQQGFFWWDEGQQLYANFKTVDFVISQLHGDGFSWDFYNRDPFNETIKMWVTKPMLTSELHVLLNILAPLWQIFMRLLYRNSFDEMIKMRGNNPMLTSKLYILVNILAPFWPIFMNPL